MDVPDIPDPEQLAYDEGRAEERARAVEILRGVGLCHGTKDPEPCWCGCREKQAIHFAPCEAARRYVAEAEREKP